MSERLPRVTAAEIIRVLERNGFSSARASGAHRIYKNQEGRRVTVAYHAGKIIHPKVLRNILQDAGWSAEKFQELLS